MSEISKLAAKCMQEKGDNLDEATALLMQRLKRRQALLNELIEPICRAQCCLYGRQDRAKVWSNEPASVEQDNRAIDALATHYRTTGLYELLLPGGKRLGESTRNEILDASARYMKQSGTGLQIGYFLKLTAAEIPVTSQATCKKHVRSKRLDELQAKAKREVDRALAPFQHDREPVMEAAE